jgi:hypothetical protein
LGKAALGTSYLVEARDGVEPEVALADDPQIASLPRHRFAGSSQGSFVGVTVMPQAEGGQSAFEVRILPGAMRGTGEGHNPWDLRPSSTMIHANVEQVVTAVDGQLLTR